MRKTELWWRTAILTIRRAPHDPRARRIVFRVIFVVVYYGAYSFVVRREMRETGWGSLLISAVLLVLGGGVAMLISRHNRQMDKGFLRLNERPAPHAEDGDLTQHSRRIGEELVRVAALVDRAAVELMYKLGKVEAADAGAARRRSLAAAHKNGVWQGLIPAEQELLIGPEGGWERQSIEVFLPRSEDVRVLRWMLGIDQVLVPFAFAEPEFKSVLEVTLRPELVNDRTCPPPSELRPAQGEAQRMFERALAEGIMRGFFDLPDEKAREHLRFYAERMKALPADDLLVGSKTVADLSEDEVRRIGQVALRRVHAFARVIAFLQGADAGIFRIENEIVTAPAS